MKGLLQISLVCALLAGTSCSKKPATTAKKDAPAKADAAPAAAGPAEGAPATGGTAKPAHHGKGQQATATPEPAASQPDAPTNQPPATAATTEPNAGTTAAQAPTTAAPADTATADTDKPVTASEAALGPDTSKYEAWFSRNNLDLKDPKMLKDDPDHDGFTNQEEFIANTDPHDPKSFPKNDASIQFVRYVETPFPYVLRDVKGHAVELEKDGQRISVPKGKPVPGTTYEVARLSQGMSADKDGNLEDNTAVILKDTQSGSYLTLVKDKPAASSDSYAEISFGGNITRAHRGETIIPIGKDPKIYRVDDLRPEQVILKETKTQRTVVVRKK